MPRNGSGVSSVVNTFVIDTVADPDEVNANFTDVADQLTNSLPRDGQAGMNAPLPLQNGTNSLPAITFSSDTNTGIYRKAADMVGIAAGGIEADYFASGSIYATKGGNYTALQSDHKATHRYTAAATASLTAVATLGSNWHYTVIADGGDVTIDPNGAELINGQATLVLPNGTSALLICDGTGFYTRVKPSVWESIGVATPAAASSVSFTNLGSYRFLRATGVLVPSAGSLVVYRTSTNNGSSYDSGATDYTTQSLVGSGGTAAANGSSGSAGGISNQLCTILNFEVILANFNQALFLVASSKNYAALAATQASELIGSQRSQATARNALQFFPTTGGSTFSGRIHLEGIKG